MRLYRVSIIILILLFSNKSYSQNYERPPGTIQLDENLYIDVAPVDNLMFLEYLQNLNNLSVTKLDSILKNSQSYGLSRKSLFDQGSESDKIVIFDFNESEEYLHHPKYAKHPVINVDVNQAKTFCEWRTKAVLFNFANVSKSEKERLKYPKKIKYRLPTNKEFNLAIETFGYSKGYKSEDKDIPFIIYRKKYKSKYKKALFIKNNLSEYTLDSLPFGKNWKNVNPTNESTNYTSFRCVCEILE